MSIFHRRALGDTPYNIIPSRRGEVTGSVRVTADTALRSSAVWACLRLRADMLSGMPLDVFRKVGDMQVEVPKPAVLLDPSGTGCGVEEFLWSSQFDLDRVGNAFGIILDRDGLGMPRTIQLVRHEDVIVRIVDGTISYKIKNETYSKDDIWHEKQFTLPGLAVGLSPVAYAAWTIGQFQSAQDFGLQWFSAGGTIPSGHLRNSQKMVQPDEADIVKRRFKTAVESKDVFVTGKDWEYTTITTTANEAQFIETQQWGLADVCRFFGVPGDLIDVHSGLNKSAITYANVVQRNLQFLIINLAPAIRRREAKLSTLLPAPRFVKLNTDSILRLDPQTRNAVMLAQVAGKTLAPSEMRALNNRPDFTEAQIQEFYDLGIVSSPPVAGAAAQDTTAPEGIAQ